MDRPNLSLIEWDEKMRKMEFLMCHMIRRYEMIKDETQDVMHVPMRVYPLWGVWKLFSLSIHVLPLPCYLYPPTDPQLVAFIAVSPDTRGCPLHGDAEWCGNWKTVVPASMLQNVTSQHIEPSYSVGWPVSSRIDIQWVHQSRPDQSMPCGIQLG